MGGKVKVAAYGQRRNLSSTSSDYDGLCRSQAGNQKLLFPSRNGCPFFPKGSIQTGTILVTDRSLEYSSSARRCHRFIPGAQASILEKVHRSAPFSSTGNFLDGCSLHISAKIRTLSGRERHRTDEKHEGKIPKGG